MKVAFAVIALTLPFSVSCVRGMPARPARPVSAPVGADELNIDSDGTARATGVVLENNHGCEVDARCFLRLQVGNRQIVVVYGPAEGEQVGHTRNTPEEWKIKKDAHVKVYGKYSKDHGKMIEVYSSESYYVRVLAD